MVESLHAEWGVDRAVIFSALEAAFKAAVRKHLRDEDSIRVEVDPGTGEIRVFRESTPVDISGLGRVAYQFAKQRFMQILKDARDRSLLDEFAVRRGTLVTAKVVRMEGGVVQLKIEPRLDAVMPLREQIPGESYLPGTLVKAVTSDVERRGPETRVVLSRSCDDFVVKLLEREVPELQSGLCKVRGVARDAGYRTKIFVESTREGVDCIGTLIGVGRSRVRAIVAELGGENVDIIRWSDDEVDRVRQAMKPAEIADLQSDARRRRATIYVRKGELSQAIGKGGRNVRLASRLTGWEIDVFEHPGETPAEQLAGPAKEEGGPAA